MYQMTLFFLKEVIYKKTPLAKSMASLSCIAWHMQIYISEKNLDSLSNSVYSLGIYMYKLIKDIKYVF